jgi:hypothetical protein
VLSRSPQGASIVVVERSESAYWERFTQEIRGTVEAIDARCTLFEQEDFRVADGSRLRMWKIASCP